MDFFGALFIGVLAWGVIFLSAFVGIFIRTWRNELEKEEAWKREKVDYNSSPLILPPGIIYPTQGPVIPPGINRTAPIGGPFWADYGFCENFNEQTAPGRNTDILRDFLQSRQVHSEQEGHVTGANRASGWQYDRGQRRRI